MSEYHEPYAELPGPVRDQHRAMQSLMEEIDAIDWYNQRLSVATNDDLRAILTHNRNEEMEHACMALEWLRRHMPGWDEQLRTYLFTEGDITRVEEGKTASPGGGDGGNPAAVIAPRPPARGPGAFERPVPSLGIGRPEGER